MEYSKSLWHKALKFGSEYQEPVLKGTFNECLHGSTRHRMRAYWRIHEMVKLQELARYAKSPRSLHSGSASLATTSSPTHLQSRLKRRSDYSNRNVMVNDSSAKNTVKNLQTNIDRVMANNTGSSATPPGTTPTNTNSTALSFDTGGRCRFGLHADHRATRDPILPAHFHKKLMDKWIQAIKTMLPRRSFYKPHPR